jgi:hypothetical protein
MKKQKVFLVTVKEVNGNTWRNPLLPSEFHLAKTILNEDTVTSITITKMVVEGKAQYEIDNKIACLF